MKPPWKKIRFVVLYSVYILAAVSAISYFFIVRPWISEMRERRTPQTDQLKTNRHIDLELAAKLGWFMDRKKSSFVHFGQAKSAEGVRVCALGDSFTFGEEVTDVYDYPSRLQRLFDRRGLSNVEVINFGTGWWGFHQTFVMWDLLARKFSCDFVVLGPQTFYPARDSAFNHSNFFAPYLIHSRYVLRGDDVERLDPYGTAHSERFDQYFRFIPRWRYLRYDRSPPATLKAMIPENKTLTNPFYYYPGDQIEESREIYRILLEKMGREDARVLVTHYPLKPINAAEIAQQIAAPNTAAFRPIQQETFPYMAPRGHNSPMGNDFLARQYFQALLQDARGELLPQLVTRDLKFRTLSEQSAMRPLNHFDSAHIEGQDGQIAGYFGTHSRTEEASSSTHLKDKGVVALMSFKNPNAGILDGCFVPLDVIPEPDAEVVLHAAGATPGRYPLGKLKWIDERIALAVLEVGGVAYLQQDGKLFLRGGRKIPRETLIAANQITVRIGDQVILRGRGGARQVELALPSGPCRRLRATEDIFFDLDTLETGRFDLVANHPEDGEIRIPIADWTREMLESPNVPQPFDEILAVRGERAVFVEDAPR